MLYAQKPPSREIKRAERRSDGLWLFSDYGTHRISPKNEKTVRISLTREDAFSDMLRPGIVVKDVMDDWSFEESTEEVVLKTSKLRISIDRKTASFKYYNTDGKLIFSEADSDAKTLERFKKFRMISAHTDKVETPDGVKDVVREAQRVEDGFSYHAMLNFKLSNGEAIYGLGQHEEGFGSLRGQTVYLHQANRKIAVPMMISTLGYGILNDCYSPVIFNDTQYGTYLYSEAVPELEYFFMYGEDMHGVVAQYRFLSGKAAMLPRWAFGYIQSQEKYDDQKDIETVLEGYRFRGIGLDCIVQDWCSWEDGKWGQKSFDFSRYPDPSGMIKKLHDSHVRFMISVWANSDAGCENHSEFESAGLFLPSQNIYNALDEEGRTMYWKQLERGLFKYGVDAWWCDNSEPITPEWQTEERPEPSRMYSDYVNATSDCMPVEQTNAFGFYHALGVYEGQRSSGSDKRVCNLTRSAYTGGQRLGTVLWSGDVAATWDTLRSQIAAGLNFCASGLPYWTTDIGAFFVKRGSNWFWRGDFEDTVKDLGYREFFVRWFQWGAFLPVFRGHGTDCRRELWNFENADIAFYDALIKINRIRYELMPYIYSSAGNCFLGDGSMMTSLAFDWPEDETAKEITDQYMFGPSLMVCPVTEPMYYLPDSEKINRPKTRMVYLPEGGWYDFWTNEHLIGGRFIEASATIDIIPVFVKEGAVIPCAEFAQSTDEQTEDLTVCVYSGCDGEFTLYEDSFDGYGYERGEYILTDLKWNDAKKELTHNRRTRWQMSDEEAEKRYRISRIKVITP